MHIGLNVWMGAAALLLPGVRIGEDAFAGACSVVTHDAPAGATLVKNPALRLTSSTLENIRFNSCQRLLPLASMAFFLVFYAAWQRTSSTPSRAAPV